MIGGNVINATRDAHNIGPNLSGCHHAEIEGYRVEGHVPAEDIARMVKERASFAGISVPGMPAGSPGMTGRGPFRVVAFDTAGQITEVYARH
ncbi:MAG: CopG family transcriptional regulator [Acidobacteria bacterium]|nr:CopG family transcriptional regulator [Acidobacteriota bacterium]